MDNKDEYLNIDPYIQLAAAICNLGIRECDTAFLNSEWFKYLSDSVIEYNQQHNYKLSNLFSYHVNGGVENDRS